MAAIRRTMSASTTFRFPATTASSRRVGYLIVDRETINGTCVNGISVAECELKCGDQIGVGDNLFRFVTGEEEDQASASPASLEESGWVATPTIRLNRDQVLELQPAIHPTGRERPRASRTRNFAARRQDAGLRERARGRSTAASGTHCRGGSRPERRDCIESDGMEPRAFHLRVGVMQAGHRRRRSVP